MYLCYLCDKCFPFFPFSFFFFVLFGKYYGRFLFFLLIIEWRIMLWQKKNLSNIIHMLSYYAQHIEENIFKINEIPSCHNNYILFTTILKGHNHLSLKFYIIGYKFKICLISNFKLIHCKKKWFFWIYRIYIMLKYFKRIVDL